MSRDPHDGYTAEEMNAMVRGETTPAELCGGTALPSARPEPGGTGSGPGSSPASPSGALGSFPAGQWWESSTTAAKPCGTCWRCGGTIYEYLVHHCTTSVRLPYGR